MLRAGREHLENLYKQHPKFRVFQEDLLSSLSSFERVQEWPDLIKCLARVNKVLAKHTGMDHIPCLVLLCKRLAQSLNPGLPSGVHLKALETYAVLLSRMNADIIVQNLGLFSAGLFPLLAYASTRVKPDLLKLYEDFFLPLGEKIVPAISGFVLALLPGIEDHTSETYQRVLKILKEIRDRTDRAIFAFSLWRAMLQSPSCRLAALNFISETIPNEPGALLEFLPQNRSIAIEAIIATLHDENVLAQREMFEMLITHLPIYSDLLTAEQTVSILHGSLPVLLRREVSVNRRFFSWLMKSDSNDVEEPVDLSEKTLQFLILALKQMVQEVSDLLVKAQVYDSNSDVSLIVNLLPSAELATRPYELLNILMEKPQIQSSKLLENLIHTLVSFAYQWHFLGKSGSGKLISNLNSAKPKEMKMEPEEELSLLVLKSAQNFFGKRISERLWGSIKNMLEEEFLLSSVAKFQKLKNRCHNDPKIETLILVDFSLNFLPFPGNKPELEAGVISSFIEILLTGFLKPKWTNEAAKCGFQFVLKLLQQFRDNISLNISLMKVFFEKLPLISVSSIMEGRESVLGSPISECKEDFGSMTNRLSILVLETLSLLFHLFETLLSSQFLKANFSEDSEEKKFGLSVLQKFADYLLSLSLSSDADLICMGIHGWIDLQTKDYLNGINIHSVCIKLVSQLWNLLAPRYSDYHHHACKHLFSLVKIDKQACHEVIAEAMLHSGQDVVEAHRRFSILWSTMGDIAPDTIVFQEALLLMLDALEDRRPAVRLIARTWLQDSLGSIERIIDPLFSILFDVSTFRILPSFEYAGVYDARLVLYAFQKLQSIIISDYNSVIENIMEKAIQKAVREKYDASEVFLMKNKKDVPKKNDSIFDPQDYLDLLVVSSLRFIQGIPSSHRHKAFL
jgi:hypothetical protein